MAPVHGRGCSIHGLQTPGTTAGDLALSDQPPNYQESIFLQKGVSTDWMQDPAGSLEQTFCGRKAPLDFTRHEPSAGSLVGSCKCKETEG